jgi:hypothetical protein
VLRLDAQRLEEPLGDPRALEDLRLAAPGVVAAVRLGRGDDVEFPRALAPVDVVRGRDVGLLRS